MLSPEVQSRLDEARKNQDNYQPNEETSERLAQLRLIMFVGATAVGKTRVIETVASLDKNFAPVRVFTTRDQRSDDNPDLFHYLKHTDESVSELLDRIEHGEAVNYAVHPTTGNIYGTGPEDYSGKYNMLATLSNGVNQMLSLPFESKHIIGLTTDPDTWAEWFNARSMSDHTRQDRLFEAALSLDWLLYSGTPGITFVSNIKGEPEQAARAVIATVQAHEQAEAMRKQAHEMLEKTAL